MEQSRYDPTNLREPVQLAELLRRVFPESTESQIGDAEWSVMQFLNPEEQK